MWYIRFVVETPAAQAGAGVVPMDPLSTCHHPFGADPDAQDRDRQQARHRHLDYHDADDHQREAAQHVPQADEKLHRSPDESHRAGRRVRSGPRP